MKIRIGDKWHALDRRQVEQILSDPAVFPVPKAPEGVLGLLYYQGQAVPVLEHPEARGKTGKHRFVILLRDDGGALSGLTADEITEKRMSEEESIDQIYR